MAKAAKKKQPRMTVEQAMRDFRTLSHEDQERVFAWVVDDRVMREQFANLVAEKAALKKTEDQAAAEK